MSENPLNLLMSPQSIAIVGASNAPSKMGTIQALNIITNGYKGKFYPVHRKEKMVLQHQAYPAAADLPQAPDLAVLIVPSQKIASLLEDFGKIGTKRAIVITAGFRETGAEGREMEKEINAVAEKYGIRFVGPNCMGIINSQISLNTTVVPLMAGSGLLGMASQSGTYVTHVLPYLRKRGMRFSKAISLGNEVNIDLVDALEYLGNDEQTRAIILYIEGIRDGKRFVEAARRITAYKPVLAHYVGGSEAGARAGLSHTGAMSGPDFLYDGIFKQAGIIRVHTIADLYAQGWALATQPPMKGKRVGILTNSGGPGSSMAYACNSAGLEVPRLSDRLQTEIRPLLETHASAANPVDLTFDLNMEKLAVTLPEIMMKSGEVDALILYGLTRTGFMREAYGNLGFMLGNMTFEEFAKGSKPLDDSVFQLPRRFAAPFLVASFFNDEDDYTQKYQAENVPVFNSPEDAARAMGSLYRYKLIRDRGKISAPVLPKVQESAALLIRQALASGRTALDEYEAKQVLAAYGVPVTREALAGTKDEVVRAAARIQYPVAVKACSWEILHKSGKGLIALHVENPAEAGEAFDKTQKAAGKPVPVLVQEMVEGNREFLAGMTRFAGFNPCVVFGLGGIWTEVHRDTTIRQAPLATIDAEEMLSDIRSAKMLEEYRGLPQVKKESMERILQTVGNIALLHPEIAEIDLNPIILHGDEPVVVDALMVLKV